MGYAFFLRLHFELLKICEANKIWVLHELKSTIFIKKIMPLFHLHIYIYIYHGEYFSTKTLTQMKLDKLISEFSSKMD